MMASEKEQRVIDLARQAVQDPECLGLKLIAALRTLDEEVQP